MPSMFAVTGRGSGLLHSPSKAAFSTVEAKAAQSTASCSSLPAWLAG